MTPAGDSRLRRPEVIAALTLGMPDPREVAAENVAAVNGSDWERLTATYAPDCVFEVPEPTTA